MQEFFDGPCFRNGAIIRPSRSCGGRLASSTAYRTIPSRALMAEANSRFLTRTLRGFGMTRLLEGDEISFLGFETGLKPFPIML